MMPHEIRDRVYNDLKAGHGGDRLTVHTALARHGPATCRELATRMGWDLNSVAPRVCELCQAGLARLAGRCGRNGRYEAVSMSAALEARCADLVETRAGKPEQLLFPT